MNWVLDDIFLFFSFVYLFDKGQNLFIGYKKEFCQNSQQKQSSFLQKSFRICWISVAARKMLEQSKDSSRTTMEALLA